LYKTIKIYRLFKCKSCGVIFLDRENLSSDLSRFYDQKYFDEEDRKNKFQLLVSPEKTNGNLWINQNAFISLAELDESKAITYEMKSENHGIYLFLISGELEVEDNLLTKRDAIGIWETDKVQIKANKNSFFLLIEVPMSQ